MTDVPNIIDKRSARRYTYLAQASVEVRGARQVVQIRDISKTGIQFFANTPIQKNIPISLIWEDPKVGSLSTHLMIVRDIRQPYGSVFQFCYGSKFVNLKDETKQNLDRLIDKTDTEEFEANKKVLDVITPESLVELILQGRLYLQNLLKGVLKTKAVFKFTKEFKDYEKKSFEKNDDFSQWIQKLTTQVFHCAILNVTVPLIDKKDPKAEEIHKLITNKLESITYLISESKKFMDKLDSQNLREDDKINIKILMSESINRLVFGRAELLDVLVKSCKSNKSYMEKMGDQIKKLIKASPPEPV